MFISRKSFLGIFSSPFFIYSSFAWAVSADVNYSVPPPVVDKSFFYASLLYAQPTSDNLKYATFVSGLQPYKQSWHYLAVNPAFQPSFELGLNYALPCSPYSASIYWTHLNTHDTSHKQASTNTNLETIEFVGPPFEMSPPVFGIKHVNAKASFDFDNILLNFSKLLVYGPGLQARVFGGISILNLHQIMTTTFSDYAGAEATPYSYPLPPDPSFSFQLKNTSKYLGAGPDIGLNVQYEIAHGFGVLGQFMGMLTAGTIKTQDNFTSTSMRLTEIGIGTSHQEITAPNATQIVFGADGKLGFFYNYPCFLSMADVMIEAGYRMATYLNAISTVNPNTLVQPGTVFITPEFSTGTMAIVSTDARSRPFSFNGPFLNVKIAIS